MTVALAPKDMSPETPARTQAGPASTQGVVPRRAGAAVAPGHVLAALVVAAGMGALGTLIDIWGAERGQGLGDSEVALCRRCHHPHAPLRKGPYQCSRAAQGSR